MLYRGAIQKPVLYVVHGKVQDRHSCEDWLYLLTYSTATFGFINKGKVFMKWGTKIFEYCIW